MPTKTTNNIKAPKKPSKAKTQPTKTSKKQMKPTVYGKIKAKIGAVGKPLIALAVVLAVATVGYFGYVYSSAESVSYAQQRQNCRDSYPNNADRRQKCIDKVDKLQAEAKAQAEKESKNEDCSKQNRQQDNTKCGGCVKGFYDKDGVCTPIAQKEAEGVQKRCANQNREYIEKGNRCGECKNNYYLLDGACARVNKTDAAIVKKDCAAKNVVYNADSNTCSSSCIKEYYVNQGVCAPLTSSDKATVQATCKAASRVYTASTNSCGNCLNTYVIVGDVCTKLTAGQIKVVKDTCAGSKLGYNAATNTCSNVCVTNYIKDATGKCVAISSVDAADLAKLCAAQNLRYDKQQKLCTADCQKYFVKTADGKCKSPAAIKEACKAQFLQFDAASNACKDSCITNYTKLNGMCISDAEVQNYMTASLCAALGRTWIDTDDLATNDGTLADCSSICLDPTATYTIMSSDVTSYCKPVDGANGLDATLSMQECAKFHRLYIKGIPACAEVCVTGYFMDDSVCKPLPADPEVNDGSTCDGPIVGRRCTTDPVSPQAQADPDNFQVVISNIEAGVSEKSCAILGRAWVKDHKVKGELVRKGGCSVQVCRIKNADVLKSNDSYYCEGSVNRIDEKKCSELNRKWLPRVKGCAALARTTKTKDREVKLNADQCDGKTSVYIFQIKKGQDECVTPSAFQQIRSVAGIAGRPVGFVARVGAKVVCERQQGMEWRDNSCRKKIVPNVVVDTGAGKEDPYVKDDDMAVTDWKALCAKYGRTATAYGCTRTCIRAGYQITNYTDPSKWDECKPGSPSTPPITDNGSCAEHGCGPTVLSGQIGFCEIDGSGCKYFTKNNSGPGYYTNRVIVVSGTWCVRWKDTVGGSGTFKAPPGTHNLNVFTVTSATLCQ